ncbi:DUF6599 family protein [bacterium]
MQKRCHLLVTTLLLIGLWGLFCSRQSRMQNPLEGILPSSDELTGWSSSDKPQFAQGDDLYLIINGAAEIYHEYGFKQAAFHSYENPDGKSINLEIYEMEDAVSAYGIYSFRKGKSGLPREIGHEAFLETYFMNVWKGPFLITLIGFDSDPETIDGLESLARSIDPKIQSEVVRPRLLEYNPVEDAEKICYIQGHLGLYNHFNFSAEDIFKTRQGLIIYGKEYSMLLLRYEDEQHSLEIFQNARDHLREDDHLIDFHAWNTSFSFKDNNQNPFHFKAYLNFIWMVSGASDEESILLYNKWKIHLNTMNHE